jgi:hypothetical protein
MFVHPQVNRSLSGDLTPYTLRQDRFHRAIVFDAGQAHGGLSFKLGAFTARIGLIVAMSQPIWHQSGQFS